MYISSMYIGKQVNVGNFRLNKIRATGLPIFLGRIPSRYRARPTVWRSDPPAVAIVSFPPQGWHRWVAHYPPELLPIHTAANGTDPVHLYRFYCENIDTMVRSS
jgi:hypothetical protein